LTTHPLPPRWSDVLHSLVITQCMSLIRTLHWFMMSTRLIVLCTAVLLDITDNTGDLTLQPNKTNIVTNITFIISECGLTSTQHTTSTVRQSQQDTGTAVSHQCHHQYTVKLCHNYQSMFHCH